MTTQEKINIMLEKTDYDIKYAKEELDRETEHLQHAVQDHSDDWLLVKHYTEKVSEAGRNLHTLTEQRKLLEWLMTE